MTDNTANPTTSGWVCYDRDCALCLRWLRRIERPLLRRGFQFIPLQSSWAKARLNLAAHDLLTEMRLLRPNEPVLGGAAAAVVLMRHVWWLWPLWLLSRIPGMMPIFRAVYCYIAANRHCTRGACSLGSSRRKKVQTNLVIKNHTLIRWFDWLPLAALLLATLPFRAYLPNWIFMWLFVTAMFAGCKWLTWHRAKKFHRQTSLTRNLGYLFLWPGMDAKSFLTGHHANAPKLNEWLLTIGRFVTGLILLWLAAHAAATTNDILNAWIGMLGLTLILHFGAFHLAALAWQCGGVPAKPLMQSPATATSLADFWGSRWNTAFNKLVHDLAFRPLVRHVGSTGATLAVFAISGVIHELAISFPARGGYGLPFGYFLLQSLGVLLERSTVGRALGLGHGICGWLFVILFTAGPAYWLFHPTFVQNVIQPMLQTISAT